MLTLRRSQQPFLFLLLAFLSIQLVACAGPMARAEKRPSEPISIISVQTLAQKLRTQPTPLLLDVRSPQEYTDGHIPTAINMDVRSLEKRLGELAAFKASDIIVYCEHGVRVRRAEQILVKAGFKKIARLAGDMSAWRRAKLPIKRGERASRLLRSDPFQLLVAGIKTPLLKSNGYAKVVDSGFHDSNFSRKLTVQH